MELFALFSSGRMNPYKRIYAFSKSQNQKDLSVDPNLCIRAGIKNQASKVQIQFRRKELFPFILFHVAKEKEEEEEEGASSNSRSEREAT